jgi:regulator of protease activity HflC (stomatin/prohibitin superfamily)
MGVIAGLMFGFLLWFGFRYGLGGFYTVGPSERAVLSTFGRAQRLGERTTLQDPVAEKLRPDERDRYAYPQVHVIRPGFYWKFPWQEVHRASVATATASIGFDPEDPQANEAGRVLEAVTKDQLNIGLTGQLRYTVSERNLYAYLFGVKHPIAHVMGYFISVLRDRIANFSAPDSQTQEPAPATHAVSISEIVQQISINDLRKHLRDLGEHMNSECASAAARYGVSLDAALITGIDPPDDVESALAAINTAHNQVSSEVSLAQAAADQKIVMSRRAVEIETLNAEAEVQPLLALAEQLQALKAHGPNVLSAYVRNARLPLFQKARSLVLGGNAEVSS